MKKYLFLVACFFYLNAISQVDLQTGVSNYSIPIFEHTDQKSGLGTAISLNYNSNGGVKADQYASNVGQGWNLNVGGRITRLQKNEPDDQWQTPTIFGGLVAPWNDPLLNTSLNISKRVSSWGYDYYYPNGYLFTSFLTNELPKERALILRYPNDDNSADFITSPRSQSDKEQDIFYINLPNRTISFVLNPDGSYNALDNSNVVIEKTFFSDAFMEENKIRTRISKFTITDEAGIKYVFEDYEKTYLTKNEIESYDNGANPTFTVSKTVKDNFSVVSTWNLTKIINPFTGAAIDFVYETINDVGLPHSVVPSYSEHIPLTDPLAKNLKNANLLKFISFSERKHLLQINYSDGYKVKFFGDGNLPLIGNSIGILNYIEVKNPKDEIIHTIDFDYKYFYRGAIWDGIDIPIRDDLVNNKRFIRLCLTNLFIDKVAALKKYKFEYFEGTPGTINIVPPILTMAQDAWGYYKPTNLIDDEVTTFNKNNLKAFLQNDPEISRAPNYNQAKTGLLKMVTLPTGGTFEFDYEQNEALHNGTLKYVGGVRVYRTKTNDNNGSPVTDVLYTYKNQNNESSGWGYDALVNFKQNKLLHQNSSTAPNAFPVNGTVKKPLVVKVLTTTADAVGVATMIKAVDKLIPGYGQVKLIFDIIKFLVGVFVNQLWYNINEWSYNCSFVNNPIGNYYSDVSVSSNGLNNGKVVYQFTRPNNMATDILPLTFPYAIKQRFDAWKYFLPKSTSYYNANGVLQKTIDNYYSSSNLTSLNYLSSNATPVLFHSGPWDWNINNAASINNNNFAIDNYYLKKGYSYLDQTIEKTYEQSGKIAEVKVLNDYASSTNLMPRETYSYNSKGEKGGTTTYYASDYNITTGAMGALKAKNIVNIPIVKLSWYVPNGSTNRFYTGITITEYGLAPNGEVKIYKTYRDYNDKPVASSAVGTFNPNSIFITYPNLTNITELSFNTNGDIVNSKTTGNTNISYVYDYNGKFAVATAINALPSDIAYTSFETLNDGNFVLSNINYSKTVFSPTGLQYANLSSISTIDKIGLNVNKTYLVTYWGRYGSLRLNGNSVTPILTLPNGWALYAHEVNGVSTVNLLPNSIGLNNVEIDELRLYPKEAKMSTVSFNESFGKVSECDMNNRITYYRYDKVGKLIMIQDSKRNAIKTFDYNVRK